MNRKLVITVICVFAGANHQTDRFQMRCESGHKLQHEQWCEVRTADQADEHPLPGSRQTRSRAQAVPAAAQPERSLHRRHLIVQSDPHDS